MVAPLNPQSVSPLRYTKCFLNTSYKERSELESEIDPKIWENVVHYHHGLYAIPFTALAFVAVVLYLLSVRIAMKEHRVSRKFFSFLVNRALGDFVACVSNVIIIIYSLYFKHESGMLQILNTLFVASFWSGMCSYICQSLMKLYGVARPLQYRRLITMQFCKKCCLISWILFVICIIYTCSVVVLTTNNQLRAWSGCTSEKCLHPMYALRNFLVFLAYIFTLIVFAVTLFLIRKARQRSESFHTVSSANRVTVQRRFRYPLVKLAIHVGTFAVFNLPYFLLASYLSLVADGCFFPRHYNTMFLFLAWYKWSIMLRVIVDSVLSMALETEIRRSFFMLFGMEKKALAPKVGPQRLTTIKSVNTISLTDSSELSNVDNSAPLTEEERRKQRSVSERGLLKERSGQAELSMPSLARLGTIEVISVSKS